MEKKGGEVLITPHQLLLFAPNNQHWKLSIEKSHNKFQKLDCKKQGRLLITPHMLLFFAPNNQIHNWKICTKQLTLSIEHFGWEICRILCRRKAGCKGIWFNQTLGSGGNFPRDLLQLPNSKLPPLPSSIWTLEFVTFYKSEMAIASLKALSTIENVNIVYLYLR